MQLLQFDPILAIDLSHAATNSLDQASVRLLQLCSHCASASLSFSRLFFCSLGELLISVLTQLATMCAEMLATGVVCQTATSDRSRDLRAKGATERDNSIRA